MLERFTRLAVEAKAAKNERDNAQRMETEALEWEHLVKRKAEKYRVTVRSAKEKVYKFRIVLITTWVMIGLYFVVMPFFRVMDKEKCAYHKPYYLLLDMFSIDATCNISFCCYVCWYIFRCFVRIELMFIA